MNDQGIYLLMNDHAGPDEASGFVVVAADDLQARRFAAEQAGSEGAFLWSFDAPCARIGSTDADQKPGVVLRDFNGG